MKVVFMGTPDFAVPSLEELSKMYDTRIVSRLIGNFNICRFFGEDIRLKH